MMTCNNGACKVVCPYLQKKKKLCLSEAYINLPERTLWKLSRQWPKARIGNIEATKLTTSGSLLYANPHIFLISINTEPTSMLSKIAMLMTTRTASLANFGFPAPNSFDTLVLWVKKDG